MNKGSSPIHKTNLSIPQENFSAIDTWPATHVAHTAPTAVQATLTPSANVSCKSKSTTYVQPDTLLQLC